MAIFGLYYTKNMLRQMKWPRKQGVLKKEVVDTFIFDKTVESMIDWAAALGAGHPKLSLQIIGYMFSDKDWDSADRPEIKHFIDEIKPEIVVEGQSADEYAPHSIMRPVSFAKHYGKSMPASALQNKDLPSILERYFLQGLLYGLGYEEEYEKWYETSLKEHEANYETYKKVGLGEDRLPSLSENYENSAAIIEAYESEVNPLPKLSELPQKLLSDARELGVKV